MGLVFRGAGVPVEGERAYAGTGRLEIETVIRIRQIFISPGHNFVGHHGQPAGTYPTVEVAEVECVAGRGLRGDRYFDFKGDYKGQITLFAWETFEQLKRELGAPHADPSSTRRNVIIEGANILSWVGREFEIQGVCFLGTEECKPCYWMNQAVHPGAEEWLKGRGGLRARILTDGILRSDLAYHS
jgi:MOSC domain-containing protein YiiM